MSFESGPYEVSCKDTFSDKEVDKGHSYLSLIVIAKCRSHHRDPAWYQNI